MASLADIERFFERVFERSTARIFHTSVQSVQLERRVERSMERARTTDHGPRPRCRAATASGCTRRTSPGAADQEGGPEALAARLADAALAFARVHGFHLADRPTVSLVADPSLARGQVEVDAVAASMHRMASVVTRPECRRRRSGRPATRPRHRHPLRRSSRPRLPR